MPMTGIMPCARHLAFLVVVIAKPVFFAQKSNSSSYGTTKVTNNECNIPTEGKVTLPSDDTLHNEQIEWWYWTGHLQDAVGRQYGFQVTFFVFKEFIFRGQLANVAITDVKNQVYKNAAKFHWGSPKVIKGGFDFAVGNHTGKGGGGHDRLHAEVDGYLLDLKLDTTRRAVLQFGSGYKAYEFGGYTYYYSRPHMIATGTLDVEGETRAVNGTGWFDHQWGDLKKASAMGWDWFSIRLDDGRDIMAYFVHGADVGSSFSGSITGLDCITTELTPGAFNVTRGKAWKSPDSGCVWHLGWNVEVAGLQLELVPVVQDQEMFAKGEPARSYWEGDVSVKGDATGRAYVELAGCVTTDREQTFI